MRLATALVTILLLTAPGPAGATAPAPLGVQLAPGSWISLEGTSTLHPFTSRSTQVAISATRSDAAQDPVDAATLAALARTSVVLGATLDVPVRSLRSGENGLDKNLWKALHSAEYPTIEYRMASYEVTPAASPDSMQVRVQGSLQVAGVERPVPLELTVARDEQGVVLAGSSALKMSDFGVKPPRLFLGALRVGDRIVVRYHLQVVPRGPAAEPPAVAGTLKGRP
jgi:hypothetical protein